MTELTAELVCRAGEALYGREWQAPMAALVGRDVRSIRRLVRDARNGRDRQIDQTWLPILTEALDEAAVDFELRARQASTVRNLLTEDDAA